MISSPRRVAAAIFRNSRCDATPLVVVVAGAVEYTDGMRMRISHDRRDESPEAKARWFQSLALSERMEVFCAVTDLLLTLDPRLAQKGRDQSAEQAQGRVRVLRIS